MIEQYTSKYILSSLILPVIRIWAQWVAASSTKSYTLRQERNMLNVRLLAATNDIWERQHFIFAFFGDSSSKTLSCGNGSGVRRSRGKWVWMREWRLSQLRPPATANRIQFSIQRHSICTFFPINCLYVGVRIANVNKSRGLVPQTP